MSTSKRNLVSNEWEMSTIERKYSVPPVGGVQPPGTPPGHLPPPGELQPARGERGSTSEDLHAWSIYRQNLNSDFTDSALGSSEKSPLPYGNFQLRESTVQSILNHPRYGPKSALSSNMYTYLKFGLPRVFPPSRGPRDGSSGYDSSEDGSPGPNKGLRGPIRARSEQDFRNLVFQSSYRPSQHRNTRAKSSSEANLLTVGNYYHHDHPRARRSVDHGRSYRQAEHRKSFHDLRTTPSVLDSTVHSHFPNQRRTSRSGSHLSLNQRKLGPSNAFQNRPHSAMGHANTEQGFYPNEVAEPGPFQFPHLQVRNLDVESRAKRGHYVVQGVSFEVRGGEILSIMSTQTQEGSLLLEALSNKQKQYRVTSQIILNGNVVSSNVLSQVLTFVNNSTVWDNDLNVKQLLHFHHSLCRVDSIVSKISLNDKISTLIEDLGLDQVANTKLSGLTNSELRRLNVAVHLLLDTDILLLDQPTQGMDIFDTFFLIEYLRQWALNTTGIPSVSGRAVILTLQPPTYEILTMISRVLIISNGHVMYSGTTQLLLPYFTSIEYPCPAYKNPSDYYLDLVTLDDLSAEAMLESSQRMAQLSDIQRRRQTPLSDPGAPTQLPPRTTNANIFKQFFILIMRSLVWSQPSSFIRYLFHILLAAIISFIIGAIFWDIPASDTQLYQGDRFGFHYTVLCIAHWPILLLTSLFTVRRERCYTVHEINEGLYGKTIYVITKVLCNLPGSIFIWLSYLVPAFIMSGLHNQGSNLESTKAFYIYVGFLLIHFHGLQLVSVAISWIFKPTSLALTFIVILCTWFFMISGFPVHISDLGPFGEYIVMSSPTWWVLTSLIQREVRPEALTNNLICRNKQVQKQDIIVQIACPQPNGTAELEFHNILPKELYLLPEDTINSAIFTANEHQPIITKSKIAATQLEYRLEEIFIILAIFWLMSFVLFWFCFFIATTCYKNKTKTVRTTNKP